MMIKRDVVDSHLKDVLAADIDKPVGLSQPPSEKPDMNIGYVILMQSPSPAPEGSWGDPEDCRYLDYQVKCVGRSHRQCARISSMVQGTMTNRSGNGEFATLITVTGLSITDRRTVSNGSIRRSGESLFEVDDIYRLVVTNG